MLKYEDFGDYTATVKEHKEAIAQLLKDNIAILTTAEIIENSNYIEDAAATLSQLYDMDDNKIITIEFTDWAGFNILKED